jgi:AmmeMemoRadiSam system protein B
MTVRPADLAGSWYPANETDCRRTIESFIAESTPCPSPPGGGIGGIVPHAGWVFSGRIACNVISCLQREPAPDTFIIFGRHLHPGSGNYLMKEGSWATPLGDLGIDTEMGEALDLEFAFNLETASRYDQDNTIELQLPFVRYFFPEARLVPIGVPPRTESLDIGKRVATLCKEMGRRALVLGSTDLTHYGYNYGYAPKGAGQEAVDWVKNENDKAIVDLMVSMDPQGVIEDAMDRQNACCAGAAAAAIVAAKELGAGRGEKIIYATSYDVRPDSSFVGYAGVLFY